MRSWIAAISIDSFVAGMFVLWKGYGMEGAGNVVIFFAWILTICLILDGLFISAKKPKMPRSEWGIYYHAITELALISALVWYGFSLLPALRFFGAFLSEVSHPQPPKPRRLLLPAPKSTY